MLYRQDCTLFTLMLILCVCIVCLHFHCLLCVGQSFIKEFYYYYYYYYYYYHYYVVQRRTVPS